MLRIIGDDAERAHGQVKQQRYDIANRRNKIDRRDEFGNHTGRNSVFTLNPSSDSADFKVVFHHWQDFPPFSCQDFSPPTCNITRARLRLAGGRRGRSKKGNLVLDLLHSPMDADRISIAHSLIFFTLLSSSSADADSYQERTFLLPLFFIDSFSFFWLRRRSPICHKFQTWWWRRVLLILFHFSLFPSFHHLRPFSPSALSQMDGGRSMWVA